MGEFSPATDVLDAGVEVLPVAEVAQRLGLGISQVHQMLRDGQLLAVRHGRVTAVPADFLLDPVAGPGAGCVVIKGLASLITVLRDGGYRDGEILRWLFTEDSSLPGTPVAALRADRGREIKRRAQAMAL